MVNKCFSNCLKRCVQAISFSSVCLYAVRTSTRKMRTFHPNSSGVRTAHKKAYLYVTNIVNEIKLIMHEGLMKDYDLPK